MNATGRSKRTNDFGLTLVMVGVATLVACKERGRDELSKSSAALSSSDFLVTTIGRRADGVISDRSMATTTVTPAGQTYALTPAGHVTQEARVDGTTRYNRADSLGRLQCVVTDSATACPTSATTALPSTVNTMALYNGDRVTNIRRRLAAGIANTRLEYDSATRNRPDRLVVSQGDCATSSCETSFALAYDVWGSRSTETPSTGQGAGAISRRFTYGPDKRTRTIRVASPQAPDSTCSPTRWDQVDTELGYDETGLLTYRKRHVGALTQAVVRYSHAPTRSVGYSLQSSGSDGQNRVTYKYLYMSGERTLAVREAWNGSTRTSRQYLFFHADRHGAPVAAFLSNGPDTGGSIQWVANRDAWGWTSTTANFPADEIPFEFSGQIRLDGTEVTRFGSVSSGCEPQLVLPAVVSNGFRDYDPNAGMYLARDPVSLLGSRWAVTAANRNLYAYVGFNPLERTDFWGLETPGSDDAQAFVLMLPFVGPGLGLRNAILNGEPGMAALNAAFLTLDIISLGEVGLIRGAGMGVARAALNAEARNIGREVITEGMAASRAEMGSARNACSEAGEAVIQETLSRTGDFTNETRMSVDEALSTGEAFLGPGYREIGKPGSGVFRSEDGMRQFRMDSNSIQGYHSPNEPHVHFETYVPETTRPVANNHVIIY